MKDGLAIALLGGFEAKLHGQLLVGFESDKSRALLAYLVVENHPHRREKLAGLLWPETPETRARHNLSQAAYNLRQLLKENAASSSQATVRSYIIGSRQTLQFNTAQKHSLDSSDSINDLAGCPKHHPRRDRGCPVCMESLEQAVTLYKGDFLEGFTFSGCPEYEAWMIVERERLHRRALVAYDSLASWDRRQGDQARAQRFARHAVALDPFWEQAHRQLMVGREQARSPSPI